MSRISDWKESAEESYAQNSENAIKKFMKKQSMKTLKGLKEIYKDKIIDLEMNSEDASGERTILEAVEFEIMLRDLKKITKRLNTINF